MSGNSKNFDDKKILKSDFYNKSEKIFNINDTDVNKILVPKKEKYGKYNSFKHFIEYDDNDFIKPLYLELPQMTGYINKFNENKNKNRNTKTMSLKVKEKKLFKNYYKIWKKIEQLIGTDYGDDDKYIKIIMKTYEDNITTNFYNRKGSKNLPEEKIPIIILNSILYTYEKYHSKIFLEECKYAKENIKTKNYIDKELKSESDSDSDSDGGTNNEE